MKINGVEFEVREITRKHNRELRTSGVDFLKRMFEIASSPDEESVSDADVFSAEEMDLILDVVYPDKTAELDALPATAVFPLVMEVIKATSEAMNSEAEEVKN